MQRGKRTADWDHTAALITHIRKCNGDKTCKMQDFHPYATENGAADARRQFKELVKKERERKR
jgi:hypothetical protein